MDKKKIIVGFLVLVGVVLVVFLVLKFLPKENIPSVGGKVKLVYWGLWEPAEVMEPLIVEYEKSHKNVEIEYVKQSSTDYRERLFNAISQDRGPDIFRFHNTWTVMLKDVLTKIPTDIISNQEFESGYYPTVVKSVKMGDGYYGVPLMIDTIALYYNEDMFIAAGVTPPTTWEELREVASKLTVRDGYGRIQKAGVGLGTTGNIDFWSDVLGLMMLQDGVDLRKVDNTISADGRNLGEEVLKYYTQFSRVDGVWDEVMPNSTSAFISGRLAMYFGPSWKVNEIREVNPDLNFKIIKVPQLSLPEVNWASYWVEGVSLKSKHQKEAFEFLKYLSSKESLRKMYAEASKIRYFGELYPRRDMQSELSSDIYARVFLEQAENADSWYMCDETHDNGINDQIIKYYEDGVSSVNNGEDFFSALKTISLGVGQVLQLYGL